MKKKLLFIIMLCLGMAVLGQNAIGKFSHCIQRVPQKISYAGTETVKESSHFSFHYTTNSSTAADNISSVDLNGNGIPDYVDAMMDIFENKFYAKFHVDLALALPPVASNGKYPVYIKSLLGGDNAPSAMCSMLAAVHDNPNTSAIETTAYSSYITLLPNLYDGSGNIDKTSIISTGSHEYMHAIQWGYCDMETTFMEMIAPWTYEVVAGLRPIGDLFLYHDVALNYKDDEIAGLENCWYYTWPFIQYLTEHTSVTIIKSIYERRAQGSSMLTAIDDELKAKWNSSLKAQFKNYVIANVIFSSATTYAPYTYKHADDNDYYISNFRFEEEYSFKGTDLTFNSATQGKSSNRLMRLSYDHFGMVSDQNFTITLTPATPSTELEFVLVKNNIKTKVASIVTATPVSNVYSISVNDYSSDYEYYPLVIRYEAGVTNANSINYTLNITKLTTTGINTNSIGSAIKVYPTPATDFIDIQLNDKGAEANQVSFEFFNITGNSVKVKHLSDVGNNVRINIADLSNGIYILRTTINNENPTLSKIVVSR